MKPTYHIVSHSHWDREWYKTFEQFRSMLVPMVDDLLDLLARDPGFAHFTLDGQTIVLDDYLAVRPEREREIRDLVRSGRLLVGPWYVLPDEFLVSGEATVRNLLTGSARGAEFGGGMRVGYIPDSFGHIAMMPAILRGFGIDTALVYRGFGGEPGEDSSEYRWTAPDGSQVLMVHLYSNGYSAGYFHQETESQTIARFGQLKEELDRRAQTSQRLLMNGGDHHWPDPKLPETLRLLRGSFDGEFVHSTVPRYVAAVQKEAEDLPRVAGELRFGYRYAFAVLGGVYSSRIYLKQKNWECQQLLQRYVEPVNAWSTALGMGSSLPLVRHAWRTLMQNHPHDSICGCSLDPVHQEMMTRFRAVRDIGDSILERRFARLLPDDPRAAGDDRVLWLFNPSPVRRSSIAEAEVRFYRQDVVVGLNPDVRVAQALPPVRSFTLQDGSGATVRHQVISRGSGYDITYTDFNYPKQTRGDRFTVLVDAAGVPPVGMAGYRIRKGARATPTTKLRTGATWIANDHLRVEAGRSGSLTLKDLKNGETYRGLNVFESTGDVGDEYNYSFPKRDRRVLSSAGSASIRVIEKGPLRSALRITLSMRVPAAATSDRSGRSARSVLLRVETTVRLTESSRFAEIETTVMNNAKDHRFRALFPSAIRTSSVLVDSQFCLVERKRQEYDLRKFTIEHPAHVAPMQRFVTVSGKHRGLTLLSFGVPEYELLPGGDGTLALTLLRCVGLLAGDDLITRPGGKAGWHSETPEAQCPGEHTFRYALLVHTPHEIADRSLLNAMAEEFHLPFLPIRRKDDPGVDALSFLSELDRRLSLSALKEAEDGEGVILRVQNPGPDPVTTTLRFPRKLTAAWSSRLDEQKLSVLPLVEGSGVQIEVPASGLCTIRLEFVN